jgi:hypothetical protein
MYAFKAEFRNPYDRVGMRKVLIVAPDEKSAKQSISDHYPNAECMEIEKLGNAPEAMILHTGVMKLNAPKVGVLSVCLKP